MNQTGKITTGQLFLALLRISSTTLGGGTVMLGLMRTEMLRRKAMTEDELADMITLSLSVPGAVAVSMAWQLGCKVSGFLGGVAAVIAVLIPPAAVFLLLSGWLMRHMESEHMRAFFNGAGAALVALLASISLSIGKKNVRDSVDWITFIAASALMICLGITPLLALFGGTALSLALRALKPSEADAR